MPSSFNPTDHSRELEAAGVEKGQAAVHAKALSTVLADVAFTHDLVRVEGSLRKEIQHSEEKLATRLESARAELVSKMETTRIESKAQFLDVNSNVERLRMETTSQFAAMDARFTEMNAEVSSRLTEMNSEFTEINAKFTEINAKFTEINAKFTEKNSKFYPLNVEMVIHRWALGILMAMSATTLALVIRPLLV